jgi:hypothetical protein
MYSQPAFQLEAGHNVSGIGERWNPAAVQQPGIPPDMIRMEMRAHDIVDVLRLGSSQNPYFLRKLG